MRRTRIVAVTLSVALLAALSFAATASWQGTWNYYNDEGALVGQWTAGCGELDGSWGTRTANRSFTQGCAVDM